MACEADEAVDSPDTAAIAKLVEDGHITHEQVIDALAEEFSMETVDLTDVRPSNKAIEGCNVSVQLSLQCLACVSYHSVKISQS